MKRIRILISSPGDVTAEREQAREVIRQLQRRYAGRLELEPILWEELPLQADMSFQEGIDIVLSGQGVDVALFVLWSRLGSPLGARVRRPDGGDYRSGTERELDLMLRARERSGGSKPAILVYVREDERSFKESMLIRSHDEIEQMISQRRAVEQFIRESFHDTETGTNLRAYHSFTEPTTFAIRLRQHLRQHLDTLLPETAGAPRSRWEHSPFRGLQVFRFEDADIFYGREREVDEVLLALHRREAEWCAFLLILGASGSGKSSLVRAGVIPQLVQSPLDPDVGPWRWAVLTPGEHAGDLIGGLTRILAAETALPGLRGDPNALSELAGALVRDPRGAWDLRIHGALESLNANGKPARLVLTIDQLEECFTHPSISHEASHQLFGALDVLARSGRVWVIATLRSDTYQACQLHPALMAMKGETGQFDLLPPTPADLRRIISEPARLAGLQFERDPRTHRGLDEQILTDAVGHPEALPLIEFALDQLYERRTAEGLLTFGAYKEIGGVEGALRMHAERLYGELPERAQQAFDSVMSVLVTVQESDQAVTCRRERLDEIAFNADQRLLIDCFTEGRILIKDSDEEGRPILTVAHEALLRAWPRLTGWIEKNKDFLRVRARVEINLADWAEHGQPDDRLLPPGIRLSEAEELLAQWGNRLSPDFARFTGASVTFARAAELRSRKRDRRIKLALSCLLLVAMAGLVAAISQSMIATHASQEARDSYEQARRAQVQAAIRTAEALAEKDPSLGKVYLASAVRLDPENHLASGRLAMRLMQHPACWPITEPLQHKSYIHHAEFSADGNRVVTASADGARIWDAATGLPLTDALLHSSYVNHAEFTADASRVVIASADGARIWDAATGQPSAAPLEHQGPVNYAEFNEDGSRIVTVSDDNCAWIWDTATGRPLVGPLQHGDHVNHARFSNDGSRVVTASDDNTARIWDAATGLPLTELLQHEDGVNHAEFSADGSWIVTASADNSARIWDATTGQPLTDPLLHGDDVLHAEFNAGGSQVVTASQDGTARIWGAATGQPLTHPLQHEDGVNHAEFSSDGSRVVTASPNGARIWDATTGQPLTCSLQHEGGVTLAKFSADGGRVITTSWDGTARIWDVATGQPSAAHLEHQGPVNYAEFNEDGSRIVTVSDDNCAWIWDTATGRPLVGPLQHGDHVNHAEFSADGSRIVTASEDNTARIWDAATGLPLTELLQHEDGVNHAEFSADGSWIVTASADNSARIWDATTGQPLTDPLLHGDDVLHAEFNAGGSQVVTASQDGTTRIWGAATGQPLTDLRLHGDAVLHAAFNKDGSRIVTASEDRTARIWDAATGQPSAAPLEHQGPVNYAEFNKDGSRIVTVSDDNCARIWDAATGQQLADPLQHQGAVNHARFSNDGSRVVTASDDNTARIWDAATGLPLTELLQHQGPVNYAEFNADGSRVVTASADGTARIWEIPPAESAPDWLAELGEAMAGKRINGLGLTEMVLIEDIMELRKRMLQLEGDDHWSKIGRWLASDARTRTTSPYSSVTVPEYIEQAIDLGNEDMFHEAELLAFGDRSILDRIQQRRSELEQGLAAK